MDRFIFGFGSLFAMPGPMPKIAIGLRPSTFLKFHQALVRRKYRHLFSPTCGHKRPGPKGPSDALIRAIVELKSCNPRFGCPRIALIISRTFGIDIDIDIDRNVVHRVLSKHYRAPPGGTGPSWLTLIGHAKDSLWSTDLFRCESVLLKSYWVLVVMDQFTRLIVGLGVQPGAVDGPNLCRMFNDAISAQGTSRYISTDHGPLFEFHRWKASLRILEINEVKTVPYTPTSHPFVERLIGTFRREFLDHVLFSNTLDLERKLSAFQAYYNEERVHSSLGGHTPCELTTGDIGKVADFDNVRWISHCHDLVQLPVAA